MNHKTPQPLEPEEENLLLRFLLRMVKTSDNPTIRRVSNSLYNVLRRMIDSR